MKNPRLPCGKYEGIDIRLAADRNGIAQLLGDLLCRRYDTRRRLLLGTSGNGVASISSNALSVAPHVRKSFAEKSAPMVSRR